ncbi:NAD(P)-binding protein [Coniophora puteana RWD-64-598 SS2]|uniref:NAD(P)-binding protein n=1 Tax=Coniophora puteana (strain RWD-64-598) TaxID=741705 RepID=A0A5M3MY73_CONPW|nr:NAD(P)-binding protein [Coniophora puteana RWD-64-598 SS2]EIW84049.1 NAD(P)-binding protein [Coniophora puteana RWD-64-598 SS2]
MSGKTQVFVTGATGYIGGSVLQRLLNHPSSANSEFTVLVRSEEKATKFEQAGYDNIKVLRGSLEDVDKIEAQAAKSDIVVHTADADDVGSAKAILAGLKKRKEETGKVPIYIHTSGTGVLVDRAEGAYESKTFYDDTDANQIESLADDQPHRNVDLLVVAADKEGYIKSYIILPSTIFGIATGPLFDKGIANPHSQQIPFLIKTGISRKQGGVVGEGVARWPCVHIDDIADLYGKVYDAILAGQDIGHGREGFYFGENGHYSWYDLSKAVSQALAEVGRSDKPEPTPFTKEEREKLPILWYYGTNSQCYSKRGRALGWAPKYGTEDMLKSVKPEVDAILNLQH